MDRVWGSVWRMLESLGNINADTPPNGKIIHIPTKFSTLLKIEQVLSVLLEC